MSASKSHGMSQRKQRLTKAEEAEFAADEALARKCAEEIAAGKTTKIYAVYRFARNAEEEAELLADEALAFEVAGKITKVPK